MIVPVGMIFTVTATGNHDALDIVAGRAIIAFALVLSAWWLMRGEARHQTPTAQEASAADVGADVAGGTVSDIAGEAAMSSTMRNQSHREADAASGTARDVACPASSRDRHGEGDVWRAVWASAVALYSVPVYY